MLVLPNMTKCFNDGLSKESKNDHFDQESLRSPKTPSQGFNKIKIDELTTISYYFDSLKIQIDF